WRRVVPSEQEAKRIDAMSDAQFADWVARAIGSTAPAGKVETLGRAFLPAHPSIDPDAPPQGKTRVYVDEATEPDDHLSLAPGEGALVLAFRRPDRGSAGQRAAIVLRRYDLAQADLA